MKITLRESTKNDEKFVNDLTKSVMREYVEKTWVKPSDQESYYEANKFNSPSTKIIQFDGVDVGRISITKTNSVLKLDEIHILPGYQGMDIGSTLILSLLRDSELPVELLVLKTNPAKNLYKRLGFKKVSSDKYRLKLQAKSIQYISGLLPDSTFKKISFDHFVKKMEMYIAASKTILQLSAASLAASIVFIDKFINSSFSHVSYLLKSIWLLMGLAIITSAFYQYLAVKCIEFRYELGFTINKFIRRLVKNPGIIFGIAMLCFLLGIISFVFFIILNIK